MLEFLYKGKDRTGKLTTGTIEAITKKQAINLLKEKGIEIISIKSIIDKKQYWIRKISKKLNLGRPVVNDLILFCRHMHSLAKSGVPIIQAIRVVSRSVKNLDLEIALEKIILRLEGGKNLYTCMKEFPEVFPEIVLALVNVGENTGHLDQAFWQLSLHFERESKTKKRVKNAIRYPIFVLLTLAIALVIVNVMVIPAFEDFFKKFETQLPLATRILIGFSDFMVSYWFLLLGMLAVVIGWWIYFLSTKPGRYYWDKIKLKIPIVGIIFKEALLARFARSFALSSKSGVPLLDGIKLSAKTTDNSFVVKQMEIMKKSIERGGTLTKSAIQTKLFTPLVLQMLDIGEQTGEVDRLLEEAADYYEKELDYDLARLGAAIEPILISIVAGMVLVLALAIYLPMWNISAAFL